MFWQHPGKANKRWKDNKKEISKDKKICFDNLQERPMRNRVRMTGRRDTLDPCKKLWLDFREFHYSFSLDPCEKIWLNLKRKVLICHWIPLIFFSWSLRDYIIEFHRKALFFIDLNSINPLLLILARKYDWISKKNPSLSWNSILHFPRSLPENVSKSNLFSFKFAFNSINPCNYLG